MIFMAAFVFMLETEETVSAVGKQWLTSHREDV